MRALSWLLLTLSTRVAVSSSDVVYYANAAAAAAAADGVVGVVVHPTGKVSHEEDDYYYRTLQASSGSRDDEIPPSTSSPIVDNNSPTPPSDITRPPPPSYEDGGKGGKGGKSSKDSKKSSKSAKSDSSSKSSKKGSKSAKSGKGPGKGGPITRAPTPSGKGSAPSAMPPSGLTGSSNDVSGDEGRPPISLLADSMPPAQTPLPPLDNLQAVSLSRYAVSYTLGGSSMPIRADYDVLGETTATYFEQYMIGRYGSSAQAELVKFETTIRMTFFAFGEPALIEYESTAYFSEGSAVVPRQSVVDTVLMEALNEPERYIEVLVRLKSPNPFAMTTAVEFKEPQTMVDHGTTASARSATSSNTSTLAAGGAGLGLLLAGAVFYKRRRGNGTNVELYLSGEKFDKNRDSDDASTLAGETYAGETLDGSMSMDRSTCLADDEERGARGDRGTQNSTPLPTIIL